MGPRATVRAPPRRGARRPRQSASGAGPCGPDRRQRLWLSRHRERHGGGRAREHPFARSRRHPRRAEQRGVAAAASDASVRRPVRRRQPASLQPRAPQRRQHGLVRRRARPGLFSRPLHDRLLVLGTGGVSRGVGAVLRLRRRSVDGERLRSRLVHRLVARPRRAHAASSAPARRPPAWTGALRSAGDRRHLSLHVRRVEPERAQEPARGDRRVPPGAIRPRRGGAGAEVHQRGVRSRGRPRPPRGGRRPPRAISRRLHGSGRDLRRSSRPPTATSRRTAPKDSA